MGKARKANYKNENLSLHYEEKESAKNKTKGTGIPGRETL
jgi:hypothetical protein